MEKILRNIEVPTGNMPKIKYKDLK